MQQNVTLIDTDAFHDTGAIIPALFSMVTTSARLVTGAAGCLVLVACVACMFLYDDH